MRLIEPILFPICVYPLEILKFAGEHSIQNFDIITNFGYQYNHLTLLDKYIELELHEKFIDVLSSAPMRGFHNTDSFVYWIEFFIIENGSVYGIYYKYFLTKYILESKGYEHTIEDLIAWLDRDNDYIFKKCFKFNRKTSLSDYYNTIIIPRLWTSTQLDNVAWINKMYRRLPISFNQSKVIKSAGDHLIGGGNLYVLNQKDYGKIFWALGSSFKNNESWSLVKKETPLKSKTTNEINWL